MTESKAPFAVSSTVDLTQREAILRAVFNNDRLRQWCISYVCKHGGNRQDGEDVFQEAIIVLDRKLRLGDYRGDGNFEAFFTGIVRWHWFNERQRSDRSNTQYRDNLPEPPPSSDPELAFLLDERRDYLSKLLKQLTEKCRNLLKMYQLDLSMEEIAHRTGYANGNVAKKELAICRKRLKVLIEKNWMWFYP